MRRRRDTSLGLGDLAAQGIRQIHHLEGEQAGPHPVAEGTRANHFGRLNQAVQFGGAAAGVQRSLVLPHLADDPTDKPDAALNFSFRCST